MDGATGAEAEEFSVVAAISVIIGEEDAGRRGTPPNPSKPK